MYIKGNVKEQSFTMYVYCDMFIPSATLLPLYTIFYYYFYLILITCICWLLTKIFTLLEGEEVVTSEDDKLLLIDGK